MNKESELQLAKVIMEPLRGQILRSLLEGPKYIRQIADATGSDRPSVSYHLGILEENRLVSSEYKILKKPRSPGVASRVYTVDIERLRKALNGIKEFMPEL